MAVARPKTVCRMDSKSRCCRAVVDCNGSPLHLLALRQMRASRQRLAGVNAAQRRADARAALTRASRCCTIATRSARRVGGRGPLVEQRPGRYSRTSPSRLGDHLVVTGVTPRPGTSRSGSQLCGSARARQGCAAPLRTNACVAPLTRPPRSRFWLLSERRSPTKSVSGMSPLGLSRRLIPFQEYASHDAAARDTLSLRDVAGSTRHHSADTEHTDLRRDRRSSKTRRAPPSHVGTAPEHRSVSSRYARTVNRTDPSWIPSRRSALRFRCSRPASEPDGRRVRGAVVSGTPRC